MIIIIMIITIMTSFQEDNIFRRVASLTYGPQLTMDQQSQSSLFFSGFVSLKTFLFHLMGRVARKPVFGVSDQARHKMSCTAIDG